ncbi:MAG: hypothetical protein FWC16_07700 [Defluviitaleaceae bacterium]|nr:hypothetical protein [Defluviitaleaceae bacterium]MCL2274799.1 hypothetical protein [Defluviitaleaceae bacterium]
MRVTNSMIFGNSLNNLHRNVRHVNTLVKQIETTKRFQRPSDDPISAARALRYRTTVQETQQFFSNVQGGLSWMGVSEAAFMSMTDNVLQRMNVLLVEAATGHLTIDDRLGLVKEMQELVDQLALEINQTYMGRYVFSGFRTHQPPVFTQDNNLSFVITQQFDAQDIERIMSFQQLNPAHKATVHNANVIKLAYNFVDFNFSITGDNGQPLAMPGIQGAPGRSGEPAFVYEIVVRSITDQDAYLPPATGDGTAGSPFVVHFIKETGEIVLCDEAAATWRDGTRVTYHKEGFRKGELNPQIYFDSIEVLGRRELDITQTFEAPFVNPDGSFNFYVTVAGDDAPVPPGEDTFNMIGAGQPMISINGAPPVSIWAGLGAPFSHIFSPGPDTWETTWATAPDVNIIQRVTALDDGFQVEIFVVNYDGTPVDFELSQAFTPSDPDLNIVTTAPSITDGTGTAVWSGTATAGAAAGSSFTIRAPLPLPPLEAGDVIWQEDYWIVHEISPSNHQRINDLARHVYTDKMYTDLKRLMDFIRSVQISDRNAVEAYFRSPPHNMLGTELENTVETQLANERAQANAVLHDRINTMLKLLARHSDNVITEHTRMGTRMSLFEMMDVRLSEEEVQMDALLSATADTNMADAIMRKTAAEAAMQAAMRATAMTVQLSLVNFLR